MLCWYKCKSARYVPLNADATVDFYAGNVAACDQRLVVTVIDWTKDQARFTIHNPTRNEIVSDFTTAAGIKGYKTIQKKITVKAGTSVEVTGE